MYRSFGQDSPAGLSGLRHAGLRLLAFLFVVMSILILAVINFFSLFFGVIVNFLGRDGVKFTFLQLFHRIPLVGVTMPVLLGYAVFHNVTLSGALNAAMPSILTTLIAVILLGGFVCFNNFVDARSAQ
ncbi:hypothetical protein [Pseudaminobacter sp. NGMCC 1.201702]|uniref:hypothetical protein n=1 Tax=Pseudaminobacter sp. NGMCC 1.201702 TaxID=3391825 RepID=UPI0039EE75E8